MLFEVLITLPDGHQWMGEREIPDEDLIGQDEDAVDLDDDDTIYEINTDIADWLLSDVIDWRWAKKAQP